MRRREFITVLGGAAAAWPFAASGQQAAKVYTVGVLALAAPSPDRLLAALRRGLSESGYTEGRNLRIEIRTADAKPDLLAKNAAELVRYRSTSLSHSSHRPHWQPRRRQAKFRL
jgi:putative ABC transport system substrate-binding protein